MAQSTRIATRRASSIHHVVTGVPHWYAGMLATTECGTKNADVHENEAQRSDALLCKRCKRSLGWDLRKG
jgi:hypothetical protein